MFSLVSCNIAAISHLTSISGSTLTTLTLEEYQFLCFQLFCCINCCHCFLIFIFQLDKTKLCTSGVKKTRSFINSFNVPSITSSSAIPIFLVAIWSNIQWFFSLCFPFFPRDEWESLLFFLSSACFNVYPAFYQFWFVDPLVVGLPFSWSLLLHNFLVPSIFTNKMGDTQTHSPSKL